MWFSNKSFFVFTWFSGSDFNLPQSAPHVSNSIWTDLVLDNFITNDLFKSNLLSRKNNCSLKKGFLFLNSKAQFYCPDWTSGDRLAICYSLL